MILINIFRITLTCTSHSIRIFLKKCNVEIPDSYVVIEDIRPYMLVCKFLLEYHFVQQNQDNCQQLLTMRYPSNKNKIKCNDRSIFYTNNLKISLFDDVGMIRMLVIVGISVFKKHNQLLLLSSLWYKVTFSRCFLRFVIIRFLVLLKSHKRTSTTLHGEGGGGNHLVR